jgi:RNA polymerase sigma-70 factor (ECF subfamily)
MRDRPITGSFALLPDGELVELAQRGQRAAFESLFHRHQNRIYTLALGIVGNEWDARDVVQETFVKTFQRLANLDKDGAVAAYLCKTASNTAIDVLRRRHGSEIMLSEDLIENEGYQSAVLGPDEALRKSIHSEELMKAVLTLRHEHRVVVVLHHLEEQPVEEIARRLNVPVGTVKSRLGRARDILRRKLFASVGVI